MATANDGVNDGIIDGVTEEKTFDWAFETFANTYPVEAYDLDKKQFCRFFRKKTGMKVKDNRIGLYINTIRERS